MPAIVAAFGFDERTVADWQKKAGEHCERVHEALVQQPQDLHHVEADEIRVRCQRKVVWLAMALCVSTRLWLGAALSRSRDKHLGRRIAEIIRSCCHLGPLLVVTDGWPAYREAFAKTFRSAVRNGRRGRPALHHWHDFVLVQTVKWQEAGRVLGIRVCHVFGNGSLVRRLLPRDQVVSTAYIERLNATFRQRLAGLCRRTRCLVRTETTLSKAVYLVGAVYNFCTPHESLQLRKQQRSPTMAAGLTDRIRTVGELLSYHVPPPPFCPPKKRGRKPKIRQVEQSKPTNPVVTV